jgi:hypothetical protein
MYCPLAASHDLANALLDVRYKGACPAALLARCDAWLAIDYETPLRDALRGSRSLPSQLDLLDKARERVQAVRWNCARQAA